MGLNDGIVLDYNFNEGTGTVTRDKSGSQNNSDLNNGGTWVAGGGLTLDGVDQFLDSDDTIALTENMTISFVIDSLSVETAERNVMLNLFADAANRVYISWPWKTTNLLNIFMWTDAGVSQWTTGTLTFDSDKHNITIVFEDTVWSIYDDGKFVSTTTLSYGLGDLVGATTVFLGTRDQGAADWINATLSKFRMYNRALSAQEIDQLYEVWRTPKFEDGIVLDMDFKEGAGTVTHDKSENQNHGTLVNTPTWVGGGGLSFNDTDEESVNLGHSASLDITDEITLALYYQPAAHDLDKLGGRIAFGKGTDYYCEYGLWHSENLSGGYLAISPDGASGVFTSPTFTLMAGTKYVIVGTFDGSQLRYYINGRLIGTNTTTGINSDAVENVFISHPGARSINGEVYNARIYNRALSEQEVRRLYEEWTRP